MKHWSNTEPTPRVKRLREYYLECSKREEPTYRIHADWAIARVMKDTEGEPILLRRAKSFAAVVQEIPVEIYPDEHFVGWVTGSPTAIPVSAEQKGARLELELDYYRYISEEEKRITREEIIPYWKGEGSWKRHWFAHSYQLLPSETRELLYGDPDPELKKIGILTNAQAPSVPRVNMPGSDQVETLGRGIINDLMTRHHIGHSCFGYEKVLKKGFLGIKKDAEDRISRLDSSNADDLRKYPFLRGVVIAMQAASEVGRRYAEKARETAKLEMVPERKVELEKMAEICDRVPADPARTFHEALQSVWFTQIMNWWETPLILAVSPGKVDQYLYPYYEKDIREGRLTREQAQELIDCWLMRFSMGVAPFIPMAGAAAHIDVGGLKADGSDATNDLSFMFLEGMIHTRMVEPNIGVMVHSRTPDDLLLKACELCALGTGHPMFLNNDVFVENFLARGTLGGPPVPLELARTSGAIGCNEPHVANYDSDYTVGGVILMPTALELALSNGWTWLHQKQMGLKTGDPREFKSFAELQDAFGKQLSYLAKHCEITINASELALVEVYPTVYQSALIEDCIENGICREAGGARYNFGPIIATAGAVDTGDSLAAIKKLVFDDKKYSMDYLLKALASNFEGYEELRQELLAVPKFGNDDDLVDQQVVWVMDVFCREVVKLKNSRGGHLMPYQNPLGGYVGAGKAVGALPSGRKAGERLSDGISPTHGSDVNGPTAVLNSVGKIDHVKMLFGQSLNMRLDQEVFGNDLGIHRLAAMIRSFVDFKIHHCQFNMVSTETLRAAQERPEEYSGLTVRVAGYVAYFTRLSKKMQDSIITRTIHGA